MDFSGQNIIVTGGTRGIGRAVSEAFLRAGANVVAVYAGNEQSAEDFCTANKEHADRVEIQKVNVADYAGVEAFYKWFDEKYGDLSVLVSNAGIRRDSIVGMMTEDDWRAVIDVNLTGTYNMCKMAVKAMMRKRYGRIIVITSPIGTHGMAGQANYSATKAGQVGFAKSLAKEVASRKITVNCVSPGFIDTDFISDLSDDMAKEYKKSVPMKRFGTANEVADSVVFLAGDGATYITGAVLEVTGGF
ncbi:3-oxoacyl-[acyl-carrier protein] reductase [hydrothermal vent metagenome]|uniref:3-oxoacyl-[acyl-carrier protein] reductase n=1 Tax=hydrothermal vent metagenome TaxID=652676 RepID=A0A3B1BBI0_9ZZZZ